MIPVDLRLQNFLSYGTAAPALDFEQFQVACLSGRNGQGKSALLDAITWALWGQARKSSGSGKPDSELLRIGTQEMEVELVFDVEGERYRVVRSYRESATGKTSTPGLELHIFDAGAEDFRPMTGSTMRETQAAIDNVVGIDYDTFINSAFLLQGRSDEFTKKRPSERKEILTRILNLDRYERLADRARQRERLARRRIEQIERDVERLEAAVEHEKAWKEEHEQVTEAAAQLREQLAAAREAETEAAQRLAALEARAREAGNQRQALQNVEQRQVRLKRDAAALRERIQEAEALVARADEIQQAHSRYQQLQQERDALDEKRDLHRGVEKRIEEREAELRMRRTELEKRLHTVEADLKGHRTALNECGAQLQREPALRKKHASAVAARKQFETLAKKQKRRAELKEQQSKLEKELAGQQQALRATLAALEEQIEQRQEAVEVKASLEEKREVLRGQADELAAAQEELEAVVARGQELKERIRERRGQQQTQQEELTEQQDRYAAFRDTDDRVCPTCGTDLTPDHRAEVERHFRERIEALREAVDEHAETIEQGEGKRAKLREQYTNLKKRIDKLDGVGGRVAALDEKLRALAEQEEALAERRERAAAVRRQLEEKAYGSDEREQWRHVREELEQLAFDEEEFEALREEASQVDRYAERLRELDEVSGRQEQLTKRVEQEEQEAERLRAELESGEALRTVQQQIRQLKQQLEAVGFDPQRFNEVRQQCRALSDAGEQLSNLVHAQQNQKEWREQLAEVEKRMEQSGEERSTLQERIEALEAELEVRPKLEKQHEDAASQRERVEADLQKRQQRLGELTARLQQAEQDKIALRKRTKERKLAEADRDLYGHLKTAFGKNGIPSLIIEQTLPEIEERANGILDRLTGGRMHVRLETLKDKKSGGTMETLDIIITDEQGVPRPYETFSGGEAFRVNFSLRIALAQLLAERSGVRIRTLVVDEGFGTQDQEGVQRMVEAIRVIQDDFDKIIVITHLQSLKEAFPVRIEVEKDPVEGSSFELIGV